MFLVLENPARLSRCATCWEYFPHQEYCVWLLLAKTRLAQAGVTVLDIGTGTGILAVMAVKAGASHVFACEVNGVLCNIARDVLKRFDTGRSPPRIAVFDMFPPRMPSTLSGFPSPRKKRRRCLFYINL